MSITSYCLPHGLPIDEHECLPDSQDGASAPYPQAVGVPSEGSLGRPSVYTTPDGAMYVSGKLHLKVLDEHGTEQVLIYSIIMAPTLINSFNNWVKGLENTVFLEAYITKE